MAAYMRNHFVYFERPNNKIKYCERFKNLITINKIIPTDYLTYVELISFGKTMGGSYRGQNGNGDLAMTSVNLAPFFDSQSSGSWA